MVNIIRLIYFMKSYKELSLNIEKKFECWLCRKSDSMCLKIKKD